MEDDPEDLLAAVMGSQPSEEEWEVDEPSDEAEAHVRLSLLGQGCTAQQALKASRKRAAPDS